jgi:uncharacterized protein YkwD
MTTATRIGALFAAVLGIALLAVALLAPGAGARPGHAGHAHGTTAPAAPGTAGITGLIAPGSVCPGQADADATDVEQERTMRCMTNYARTASGLAPLDGPATLAKAANRKVADLIRCNEFSHEACGRPFTYWMRQSGYLQGTCWQAGENIAFGGGRLGGVRKVFVAWMLSPGHRENILGAYEDIGVGLRIGTLEGHVGAHVWTQEFGSTKC